MTKNKSAIHGLSITIKGCGEQEQNYVGKKTQGASGGASNLHDIDTADANWANRRHAVVVCLIYMILIQQMLTEQTEGMQWWCV